MDASTIIGNVKNYLGSQDWNGLCESFAEKVTGAGNLGASAIDAWKGQIGRAVQGTVDGAGIGDLVYFGADASNRGYGHAGVMMGPDSFASATDTGVKIYSIADWLKLTGQKLLGYVPKGAAQNAQPMQADPTAGKIESLDGTHPDFTQAPNDQASPGLNWSWGPDPSGHVMPQVDLSGADTKYTADYASGLDQQLQDLRSAFDPVVGTQQRFGSEVDPAIDEALTFKNTMSGATQPFGDIKNISSYNIAGSSPDVQNMVGHAISQSLPHSDNPWAQQTAQIGSKVFSQMLGPDLASKLTPVFVKQIQTESNFNPNAASPAGAVGIAQIMPNMHPDVDPRDPVASINYAAKLMANSLTNYGGNMAKALAAYNAGAGTVNAAIEQGGQDWMSYLPGETKGYLNTILGIGGF